MKVPTGGLPPRVSRRLKEETVRAAMDTSPRVGAQMSFGRFPSGDAGPFPQQGGTMSGHQRFSDAHTAGISAAAGGAGPDLHSYNFLVSPSNSLTQEEVIERSGSIEAESVVSLSFVLVPRNGSPFVELYVLY